MYYPFEKIITMKKLTTIQFIRKAMMVWGDEYSYEKTQYVTMRQKLIVSCRKHGDFNAHPGNFINLKSGCPVCGGQHGKSKAQFISDARKVHGDKYDYSLVSYLKTISPVEIICPIHGAFLQKPTVHLKGCGCPKCGNVARLETNEFVRRAIRIHGEKYDYSQTKYQKAMDVISIICPTHGEFKQLASNHLSGRGCPKCGRESHKLKKTLSLSNAIEICQGKKYHLVEYGGKAVLKSTLKCEKGHVWETTLCHIQQGSGCPVCAIPGYNPSRYGYVYVLVSNDHRYMKIGLSNFPKKRIRTLVTSTPFEFSVKGWIKFEGKLAPQEETKIHKILTSAEFKNFDGCTEWFIYDENVINEFLKTGH